MTTRKYHHMTISLPQTTHLTIVCSEGILSNFFEPQPGQIGHALAFSIRYHVIPPKISISFLWYQKKSLSERFFKIYQLSGFINFSSDDEDVNLEYLYNIGLSHAKRGNPRDAIFYFDKVLDVEPNHVNALANKGNALGKLGKYDQAITCYDVILKDQPEHMTSLLNKGLALHYLGRYSQAITCYDKILEQSPDNASVLYHKACTKSLQKETDQSLELLEKAILIDGEFAKKASMDKDFDSLHDDSRFKSLTA